MEEEQDIILNYVFLSYSLKILHVLLYGLSKNHLHFSDYNPWPPPLPSRLNQLQIVSAPPHLVSKNYGLILQHSSMLHSSLRLIDQLIAAQSH